MENIKSLRIGMAGLGMIFDETYLPVFLETIRHPLWFPETGPVIPKLHALYSRTGTRGKDLLNRHGESLGMPSNHLVSNSPLPDLDQLDALLVATPDDRHFSLAREALNAGKHVLIEKPSVLSLHELDVLNDIARQNNCLARVVYHKLLDPDHKRLRTLVHDGVMRSVRSGYATLLEPKQICSQQFSEWITGRNPGSYVAVHYIKLIDFTFGLSSGQKWALKRISATGQRGIAGPAHGNTWDSVQLRVEYEYPDGREAAFDIHTSWVNPDCFPGYVDQEVQFRFENAIWLAHQRKRGVELSIEGMTPLLIKETPNHHYNSELLDPWNQRSRQGYGLEVIRRFFGDIAFLNHGGHDSERDARLTILRSQEWCDLSGDRNTVAIVQAMEGILQAHANGSPGGVVTVNGKAGGLVLCLPGDPVRKVLYNGKV